MILEIERTWGKHPGWFSTLDHDHQVALLGHRRSGQKPRKGGRHGTGRPTASKRVKANNPKALGFWGLS